MAEWSKATLTKNQPVGPALHRLGLSVSEDISRAFHVPGQYHRVRLDDGSESVFAMASAPGARELEYLVRGIGEVAEKLIALGVGAQVDVDVPDGPGFPLTRAGGRPLVLIGTGTGFAPLRSVILTVLADRAAYGPVHGLYGAHDQSQLAYAEELQGWGTHGIHITPTLSRADDGWTGARGRVQQWVATLPVENALAFLCGQPDMVAEVTQLLGARGVPPDQVFVNYPIA